MACEVWVQGRGNAMYQCGAEAAGLARRRAVYSVHTPIRIVHRPHAFDYCADHLPTELHTTRGMSNDTT